MKTSMPLAPARRRTSLALLAAALTGVLPASARALDMATAPAAAPVVATPPAAAPDDTLTLMAPQGPPHRHTRGFFDVTVDLGGLLFKPYDPQEPLDWNAFHFEVVPRVSAYLGSRFFVGAYGVLGAHGPCQVLKGMGMFGGGLAVGLVTPLTKRLLLQPELGAAFVWSPNYDRRGMVPRHSKDVRMDAAIKVMFAVAPNLKLAFGPYYKGSVPAGPGGNTSVYAASYGLASALYVPL